MLKCYLVNSRRVKVKVRLHALTDVFKLPTDVHGSGGCQLPRGLCFLGFVCVCILHVPLKSAKGWRPFFQRALKASRSSQCAQFMGWKQNLGLKNFRQSGLQHPCLLPQTSPSITSPCTVAAKAPGVNPACWTHYFMHPNHQENSHTL